MRTRKSIFTSAVIIAMMMAVLVGCVGSSASIAHDNAPQESSAKGFKIAIVTCPSSVDDGSFNQDNYTGIRNFIANNPGTTVTPIQETDVANAISTVAAVVADYDIIVLPGYQFAEITTIAQENPGKKFILVDTFPADPANSSESIVVDNIYAVTFAEEESGFFAGIAAALETKTGKVAVVNGIAYPSNVNYQYGFMSGVNYSNTKYGTNAVCVELAEYAGTDVTGANVGGNYIGDFNDESGGEALGSALINEGCDVILVAAGTSGNGVFAAAKEHGGVMVIGCDVDQFNDGKNGDKNIILTSVVKVMHLSVERTLQSIQDGTFKGGNMLLRADTDSTGYISAAGRHQMGGDTISKLDDVYNLVQKGDIVPASNFNGSTPYDFKGLK